MTRRTGRVKVSASRTLTGPFLTLSEVNLLEPLQDRYQRFASGRPVRVVEHWDVLQVPPEAAANDNATMF
jgi:hypothetical protein